MGFHGAVVRDIDTPRKKVLDGVNDADMPEHVHARIRRDLDHDIDIGAVVAPRAEAEQRGMRHATSAKVRMSGPGIVFETQTIVMSFGEPGVVL